MTFALPIFSAVPIFLLISTSEDHREEGANMATKQATRQSQNQAITLKGSTAIVTEFFEYSVNRSAIASRLHVASPVGW